MGLLSNLRVLSESDIGDRYRDLCRKYDQLVTDFEEYAQLSEARYRRLSKRLRDDQGDMRDETTVTRQSDRVGRLVARRAARSARVPAS